MVWKCSTKLSFDHDDQNSHSSFLPHPPANISRIYAAQKSLSLFALRIDPQLSTSSRAWRLETGESLPLSLFLSSPARSGPSMLREPETPQSFARPFGCFIDGFLQTNMVPRIRYVPSQRQHDQWFSSSLAVLYFTASRGATTSAMSLSERNIPDIKDTLNMMVSSVQKFNIECSRIRPAHFFRVKSVQVIFVRWWQRHSTIWTCRWGAPLSSADGRDTVDDGSRFRSLNSLVARDGSQSFPTASKSFKMANETTADQRVFRANYCTIRTLRAWLVEPDEKSSVVKKAFHRLGATITTAVSLGPTTPLSGFVSLSSTASGNGHFHMVVGWSAGNAVPVMGPLPATVRAARDGTVIHPLKKPGPLLRHHVKMHKERLGLPRRSRCRQSGCSLCRLSVYSRRASADAGRVEPSVVLQTDVTFTAAPSSDATSIHRQRATLSTARSMEHVFRLAAIVKKEIFSVHLNSRLASFIAAIYHVIERFNIPDW